MNQSATDEAIKILEEVIGECEALKRKCYDSIRKLQGGVYHEAVKVRSTAGKRRAEQIRKQCQK